MDATKNGNATTANSNVTMEKPQFKKENTIKENYKAKDPKKEEIKSEEKDYKSKPKAENLNKNEETYLEKIKQMEDDLEREKELISKLKYDYQKELDEKEKDLASANKFKDNFQKILDEKNKELKEKEKVINMITITNTKLMQQLDELKKEVDTHLDKVSIKQLNEKIKKSNEVKQNPLEIVIKVREKELKNANQLVEILRKDNENLLRNIGTAEFKNILETKDKLKFKEKENADLITEIKTLNRVLEEHKKCQAQRKEIENELKLVKDDYKQLKDNYRMQQNKIKEDEKSLDKRVNQLITMKKELDKINKNESSANRSSSSVERKKINNLNHDNNVEGALKTNEDDKLNVSKEKSENRVGRSVTTDKKQTNNKLSSTENNGIKKIITITDYENIEKKLKTLDHSKQSIENKFKSDFKALTKKMTDQQERLEYLNVQLKESEQKSKISSFQLNEYKNEQKVYQRKINEMQGQFDSVYKLLKEREQENKILLSQLNSLRKIVKHNAVPPMDNEIVKHLEKIKNEDSDLYSKDSHENDIDKNSTNLQMEDKIHKTLEDTNNQIYNKEAYGNSNLTAEDD